MAQIAVPFPEWLPDLPAYQNPGTLTARNVVPHANSYRPLPALTASSPAMDEYARGAISTLDNSGNHYVFAGNASKLYQLDSAAATDRSKAGGYSASARWEFAQWGNDLYATNYDDALQKITLGGVQFADAAGTPPKAKHMAVIGDFVCLGNVNDTTVTLDGLKPNRVHWCGINDPTTWTPSSATQADYQDLHGAGGDIKAVVGGEFGVVFRERQIWRMDFIGSPLVFQFSKVEDNKGTEVPGSAIRVGRNIFYYAPDGFHVFMESASEPIGKGRIDKTFQNDIDANYLDRVSVASDPGNHMVIWSYPGAGNVGGQPNKLLLFDYKYNRWSEGEVTTDLVLPVLPAGQNLDQITDSLETIGSVSLDSTRWQGGALTLGAINGGHQLAFFDGSPLDATIDTTETQFFPGQRSAVSAARPFVESGAVTVAAAVRDSHGDTAAFGGDVALNSAGEAPLLVSGRYLRFRVKASGDWDQAQAVEITASPEGGL